MGQAPSRPPLRDLTLANNERFNWQACTDNATAAKPPGKPPAQASLKAPPPPQSPPPKGGEEARKRETSPSSQTNPNASKKPVVGKSTPESFRTARASLDSFQTAPESTQKPHASIPREANAKAGVSTCAVAKIILDFGSAQSTEVASCNRNQQQDSKKAKASREEASVEESELKPQQPPSPLTTGAAQGSVQPPAASQKGQSWSPVKFDEAEIERRLAEGKLTLEQMEKCLALLKKIVSKKGEHQKGKWGTFLSSLEARTLECPEFMSKAFEMHLTGIGKDRKRQQNSLNRILLLVSDRIEEIKQCISGAGVSASSKRQRRKRLQDKFNELIESNKRPGRWHPNLKDEDWILQFYEATCCTDFDQTVSAFNGGFDMNEINRFLDQLLAFYRNNTLSETQEEAARNLGKSMEEDVMNDEFKKAAFALLLVDDAGEPLVDDHGQPLLNKKAPMRRKQKDLKLVWNAVDTKIVTLKGIGSKQSGADPPPLATQQHQEFQGASSNPPNKSTTKSCNANSKYFIDVTQHNLSHKELGLVCKNPNSKLQVCLRIAGCNGLRLLGKDITLEECKEISENASVLKLESVATKHGVMCEDINLNLPPERVWRQDGHTGLKRCLQRGQAIPGIYIWVLTFEYAKADPTDHALCVKFDALADPILVDEDLVWKVGGEVSPNAKIKNLAYAFRHVVSSVNCTSWYVSRCYQLKPV